ncbi:hypothetical protein [Chromobacterium amazonense]|uniref:hypothetical protein n=1 Tax=Chromobacterium amazonense TaxID=1382803 RepID=UPI003F7A156F
MILTRSRFLFALLGVLPATTLATDLPQNWAMLSREQGCIPAGLVQPDLGRPMTLTELGQRMHGQSIEPMNAALPFPLWRIALPQEQGERWVLSASDCQAWLKLLAHTP